MGNCKSFLNTEKIIPNSTPKMITIQKRNQVKTKEDSESDDELKAVLIQIEEYEKNSKIDNNSLI